MFLIYLNGVKFKRTAEGSTSEWKWRPSHQRYASTKIILTVRSLIHERMCSLTSLWSFAKSTIFIERHGYTNWPVPCTWRREFVRVTGIHRRRCPINSKFGVKKHNCTRRQLRDLNGKFLKFKMPDGHHFEYGFISIKFVMQMQFDAENCYVSNLTSS